MTTADWWWCIWILTIHVAVALTIAAIIITTHRLTRQDHDTYNDTRESHVRVSRRPYDWTNDD